MASLRVLSTVLNWPKHNTRRGGDNGKNEAVMSRRLPATANEDDAQAVLNHSNQTVATNPETLGEDEEDDFKLPKRSSLVIVLWTSFLLQISFFIIISSSSEYSMHLGGGETFSGLVIGIPTLFSGLALVPMSKIDQGKYGRPLHIACGSALLGNILYALAYRANFLYLILIGRIVSGFGFTFWMYAKRYCSDPQLVGIRRRTTLASYLVVGQAGGFSLGPLFGGLLYKVGFHNNVFNGYTAPGWVMAGVWALFWVVAAYVYEEEEGSTPIPLTPISGPPREDDQKISWRQYAVISTICWVAMMCFFVLGAWESNIPIFGASSDAQSAFHWSPFDAGNFIAIGGGAILPFLFANITLSRRFQDRYILVAGTSLGLTGLILMMGLVRTTGMNYGSFFVAWFLVALGFNLASTCTISLLSKQLPGYNKSISFAIQYSNYTGRVTGAVWGGAGVPIGMHIYLGLQILIVGMGILAIMILWKGLKAKTG